MCVCVERSQKYKYRDTTIFLLPVFLRSQNSGFFKWVFPFLSHFPFSSLSLVLWRLQNIYVCVYIVLSFSYFYYYCFYFLFLRSSLQNICHLFSAILYYCFSSLFLRSSVQTIRVFMSLTFSWLVLLLFLRLHWSSFFILVSFGSSPSGLWWVEGQWKRSGREVAECGGWITSQ